MTDPTERGLKRLICTPPTTALFDPSAVPADAVRERSVTLHANCICGHTEDMGAGDLDPVPEEAAV